MTFVETFLLYGGLSQIMFFSRRSVSLFLLLIDLWYVIGGYIRILLELLDKLRIWTFFTQ